MDDIEDEINAAKERLRALDAYIKAWEALREERELVFDTVNAKATLARKELDQAKITLRVCGIHAKHQARLVDELVNLSSIVKVKGNE